MAEVACPHCGEGIGGDATEGGLRVRLGIVLVDPATGAVHGPCPRCKGDVVVVTAGTLGEALRPPPPKATQGTRRLVVPGLPTRNP